MKSGSVAAAINDWMHCIPNHRCLASLEVLRLSVNSEPWRSGLCGRFLPKQESVVVAWKAFCDFPDWSTRRYVSSSVSVPEISR